MFLTKDYIYQREFTVKRGVTINNLSNLFKKNPEAYDNGDVVTQGQGVFFRKDSKILGPIYGELAKTQEYTDFSNKLLCSHLRSEYKCKMKYLEPYGKQIEVCGAKVFEFNENFVKKYDGVWYPVEGEELKELLEEMPDLGHFQVAKNQFVVVY